MTRDDFLGLLEPGGKVPYLVLSQGDRARWALPSPSPKVLRSSMAVYSPTTARAIAGWHGAALLARTGLGPLLPGRRVSLRARITAPLAKIVGLDDLYLSIATSFHGDRCVVGMVDAGGSLCGFAKLAPMGNPPAVARLREEADTLGRIGNRLAPVVVPKVLHLGRLEDFEALVLTPIAGRVGIRPPTLTRRWTDAAARIFGVRGPATTLGQHLDLEIDDPVWSRRLEGVRSVIGSRADLPLPSGLVHGDFAAWNVRDDGRRVGVIDWEQSRFDGLPYWDLWHFAVLTAVSGRSRRTMRAIHRGVRGQGALAGAIRRYAAACSVPVGVAPAILLVYLLRQGLTVIEQAEAGARDARRGLAPWERLLDDMLEALA